MNSRISGIENVTVAEGAVLTWSNSSFQALRPIFNLERDARLVMIGNNGYYLGASVLSYDQVGQDKLITFHLHFYEMFQLSTYELKKLIY